MQPNTQEAPGYFIWQAPGKPFAVHLHLAVVDRLNAEIMRGFALVPKRGAEVGGVLFGSIETGQGTVVRVDDFEPVACEYRRGPSYYLSESEQETLGDTAGGERGGLRAVGYYRSHTREGTMGLGSEDLDLIGRYFQDLSQVALLVRPFATKVGVAGFFPREDGAFPPETPLEFPFRRREMMGEEAPARRSMHERRPRNRERRPEPQEYESRGTQVQAAEYAPEYAPEYVPEAPLTWEEFADPPKPRSPWFWVLLSVVLLALGAAVGYQLALTYTPGLPQAGEAFALDLAVVSNGDSLAVRWNRESPAVRSAQRGVLEILDGEFSKSVTLDAAHLKEGTVVYQNSSPKVQFRLVMFLSSNTTLNETVDWSK
ncbi:MAG: hypothetical protein ABIR70_23970 [Bryobacteraceae bacterium]